MLQQFVFQRFLSLDIQVVGGLIEQTSACDGPRLHFGCLGSMTIKPKHE
jgi:hypothetical protein